MVSTYGSYRELAKTCCPVKYSAIKLIGEGKGARCYFGKFRHNFESDYQLALLAEDLSGELTHVIQLKGLLDLFRDDCREHFPELATSYEEVFPTTISTYLADTTLDDHGVMIYECPNGWFKSGLTVLNFRSALSDPSWDSENLIWLTERLIRATEVMATNDFEINQEPSRYVVSWQHRKLMLLDLHGYRCYTKFKASSTKRYLADVTEMLREQLEDWQSDDPWVVKFNAALNRLAHSDDFDTVANARAWYLQQFPGADQ